MCCKDVLTQIFHFTHLIQTNGVNKWDQKPVDYNLIINVIKMWQNEFDGSQTQVINTHDVPKLVFTWLDEQEFRYEFATSLSGLFTLLNGTTYSYQGEETEMINADFDDINSYTDEFIVYHKKWLHLCSKYDQLCA